MDVKGFGWVVLVVGVLWLIVALNMDVSVATGYGRVNNIGLMASRQNHIIFGSVMALCGLLMAILGKRKPGDAGDRVKCPFCAELISEEAIKCKHCGSDVEMKKTAPAVDESVWEASNFIDSDIQLKKVSVETLINYLKSANPDMTIDSVRVKYNSRIVDLIGRLPPQIRDDFKKELKRYF